MTMIAVNYPEGRISLEQRRVLAETLTDAVLVPEVGQFCPPAREGFQVRFSEFSTGHMGIGGKLLVDTPEKDIILINILVMDGDWRNEVRKEVIQNILSSLAQALDVKEPSPGWWVSFQVIDEGSWGSRGGVLSILDLLDSGVFTEEKAQAIRNNFSSI